MRITVVIVDRVIFLSEVREMPTSQIVEDTGLSSSSVCTIIRIRKAALARDYDTLIYLAGTSAASGLMVGCQKSLFHKIEIPPDVIARMNDARNEYLIRVRKRRQGPDERGDCGDQSAPAEHQGPSSDDKEFIVATLLKELNETLSKTNRLLILHLKCFEAAAASMKN